MSFLTRVSLANRAVVALLSLLVIGVGLFATTSLKQELFPSLQIPGGAVVSSYPGAAPDVVEREVTTPVEDAVKGVSGVTRVSSTTLNGVSQVQVEWDYDADADQLRSDIDAALGRIQAQLPDDVDPTLTSGSIDDAPIVALAVTSDLPEAQLSQRLEDIAVPTLSGIDGVRSVSVSGARAGQVQVTFRPADVERFGVQPATLAQVLEANGAAVPAGSITAGSQSVAVQVGRALAGVEQVAALRLQGEDGPVALSRVADVVSAPEALTSLSRTNGEPALGLSVVKEIDGNTVAVANEVIDALPGISGEVGGNTRFEPVFEQAPFIEQSIHDLSTEGLLGLAFAVLVIFAFLLSVRPTLIAAISIPLSLLIAMIGLWQADQSLNIFTLGALTVAIGRVVDDSIVVIENIKRHLGRGEHGHGAIVAAVREVAGAVTASTITTVAVFLPLGLVGGQVGELFRPFALTVTIALLASLLVSLTIVPVLASWLMRPSRRPLRPAAAARRERRAETARARDEKHRLAAEAKAEKRFARRRDKLVARLERKGADERRIDAEVAGLRTRYLGHSGRAGAAGLAGLDDPEGSAAQNGLQRAYLPALRFSLAHRALTLVLAFFVFAGTLALVPRLRTDFLGEAGQDALFVTQTLPPGTSLAATDGAAKKVEAVLQQDPAVQTVSSTVGAPGGEAAAFGGVSGANSASMNVMLTDGEDGVEATSRLREAIAELAGVGEVEVGAGGGTGSNEVAVEVQGYDLAALRRGSDQVVADMKTVPGLAQVSSDLAENTRLLQVDVDPQKAAAYGMTQAEVGQAVRAAMAGTTAGQVDVGDETQDILVRSQEPVTTVAQLRALELPVTQKQTADAQQAAADRVQSKQEAQAQRQQEDAQDQADEQLAELRDGRDQAREQVRTLERQLDEVRAAAAAPAPVVPPGAPAPGPDPRAAAAQQLAQLEQGLEQAREQAAQLDEQIDGAQEQQQKAERQADEAQQLADETEAAREAEGTPRTLAQVATVRTVAAPATITRVDGARSVTVTATPTGGDLGATTTQLQAKLDALALPSGVTASLGGVSTEQQDAFTQLGFAMLIAIAIVFLVMVATFRSLVQPLILLVSIPFAATGAIGLLLLTDTPLGLPAMIGLLMLIGIVVTNAIVLIDLVNQYREQGASIDEAIIHGARLRLRPILMTALATIFALVPMSLGITGGGVFISKPLAIVVIGGLISSTLLTLLLVPVLYDLVERLRTRRARRRAQRGDEPGDVRVDDESGDLAPDAGEPVGPPRAALPSAATRVVGDDPPAASRPDGRGGVEQAGPAQVLERRRRSRRLPRPGEA